MSEQDWNEEVAPPPKKKGLPGWLMFCGGGCLIAMILGSIGFYFVFEAFSKSMDPEENWARLEEHFDIDARPPELDPMFSWSLGMDFWMLMDDRGYIVVIYDFGEAQASERDAIFSEDFKGGGLPGLNKIDDPKIGVVNVQGRELKVVRFENSGGFNPGGQQTAGGQGPACFVDITDVDDPGFQMVFLMRGPGGEDAKEEISDEAIQDFLEPFVIGPDREVYVAPFDSEMEDVFRAVKETQELAPASTDD